MTTGEYEILKGLPLEVKIEKTLLRIQECLSSWGKDGCYVSFSGGKDSTVLLHLARQIEPELKGMYVDMALEYPEVKTFVKSHSNIDIIKPASSFKEVLQNKGYPVLSKEGAKNIYYARRALEKGDIDKYNRYALGYRKNKNGELYQFNSLSKLGLKLLNSDFKISSECCNIMKKAPAKKYEKETGRHPILATLAEESLLRKKEYLKTGCNVFSGDRPRSIPLSFWTEQDILKYLYDNNIPIAPVYGDIIIENGIYKTTGIERTGCVYCLFGVHKEKEPNRFQKLKEINPKMYEYCMKSKEDGGLGLKEILDYMEVPY